MSLLLFWDIFFSLAGVLGRSSKRNSWKNQPAGPEQAAVMDAHLGGAVAGCPVPHSLAGMQGVGSALGLPGGLGCSCPCCCSLGFVLFSPGPFQP